MTGPCLRCGRAHDELNPRTGRRYSRCTTCRPIASLRVRAFQLAKAAAACARPVPRRLDRRHDPITATHFWRHVVNR